MLYNFLPAFVIFTFGATLGSFLHVVALRLPQGRSFTGNSRSACPHCHATLSWRELIPVFSFLIQRGRCRTCKHPISLRYPLAEIATGLVALLLFWPLLTMATPSPQVFVLLLLKLIIVSLLIILFIIDADTFLLPDKLILLLLTAAVLHQGLLGNLAHSSPYLGIAVGSGFLGMLHLLTRGQGLGLGDVKLMVPLGLLLGPASTAVLLFMAFGAGALIALYLLFTKQATSKTAIPFGPYLCASAILILLFPQLVPTLSRFIGFL